MQVRQLLEGLEGEKEGLVRLGIREGGKPVSLISFGVRNRDGGKDKRRRKVLQRRSRKSARGRIETRPGFPEQKFTSHPSISNRSSFSRASSPMPNLMAPSSAHAPSPL